jgi:hypothetical protein
VQEQIQKQVLHCAKVPERRTVMENETLVSNVFEIEKCRAENNIKNWVECLSPEQAHLCGNSLSFGNGYFCKHSRRYEFIEITKNLQSKLNSLPDVPQSDNQ